LARLERGRSRTHRDGALRRPPTAPARPTTSRALFADAKRAKTFRKKRFVLLCRLQRDGVRATFSTHVAIQIRRELFGSPKEAGAMSLVIWVLDVLEGLVPLITIGMQG
jgi:hypothetical protein